MNDEMDREQKDVISLTPKQKKIIKKHLQMFAKYTSGEQFQKDQKNRLKHISYFQQELPKKIDEVSEMEIEKIITILWATGMFGNKQYLAQKIISDNGIETLQRELKLLFDTSSPVGARYEHFLREIKGLGPASVTEMLCSIQPDTCGIWNRRARQALKILGLDGYVNPDKYEISGNEYETFNKLLLSISKELKSAKFHDVDLFFVDYFLYEVNQNVAEQPLKPPEVFDHDEIRDLTQNIGGMLGFDAETEIQIGYGARVDVVWRARIGNLGMVTYVFEVQKSGSIEGLLLKLQKAKSSPTVQKVIAISDEPQLEKIKHKSEGLPEEFRRSLILWKVEEVEKVSENLQLAVEVINRLGLVREIS